MSIGGVVYRKITRRFSTLFLATTLGAFVMNYSFNAITDAYWDRVNAGKQWKDIKQRISSD